MNTSPKMSAVLAAVMVVATLISTARVAEAQPSTQDCVSKLVPCANYLNSTTTPPSSCCSPLREAVTKELPCLCTLYNTPGLLASFGINVTQALRLSRRCSINQDLSACNSVGAPAPSVNPTPAGPAGPGGVPGNGAGKVQLIGLSSLLLLVATVMAC